jgi:hypothetical protein
MFSVLYRLIWISLLPVAGAQNDSMVPAFVFMYLGRRLFNARREIYPTRALEIFVEQ